jgi:hypothetical protein
MGSTRSSLCGLVRDAAAPKIMMIAQMVIPSVSADETLSAVTEPPMRIPGIHDGRGITGIENKTRPGIGTPITTPITVRTKRIQAESFKLQLKLLPQGAFSRLANTTAAIVPTHRTVNMVESNRMTAIANPKAHIHQVSGCSCSGFIGAYFLRIAGVGISTPHSFAGKFFKPQINPELAARTFTTCPRTSIPWEDFAVRTHVVIVAGSFSPFGAQAVEAKSMTKPIRFVSLSAFVLPQIFAKLGNTVGG